MSSQELVAVSGREHTTRSSTIKQFPASRLAMLVGRDQEFRMVGGQILVDRDGVLFSFILDFLRTHQLLLPTEFSDYLRLQREAVFYELDSLVDLLKQELLLQPKLGALGGSLLMLRNTQAFFRVFGSCSKTIEMLTEKTVFIEQPSAPTWSTNSQMTLLPLPPQRPYQDLVFQCGSDSTTDKLESSILYVSIKPDNQKLANGTNVLGLLIDTLLKEGFRLVSTRTVSSKDKTERYSFERIKRPQAVAVSKTLKPETTIMPEHTQKKLSILF
ncbi:LOW QUALITY PROTEIN: potassium channel regulatory protein [Trichechus inunguis]